MHVTDERFLQDHKPRLNQIQVCSSLIWSREEPSVLINIYLLSIYTHNLIPAIENNRNKIKYLQGFAIYSKKSMGKNTKLPSFSRCS